MLHRKNNVEAARSTLHVKGTPGAAHDRLKSLNSFGRCVSLVRKTYAELEASKKPLLKSSSLSINLRKLLASEKATYVNA